MSEIDQKYLWVPGIFVLVGFGSPVVLASIIGFDLAEHRVVGMTFIVVLYLAWYCRKIRSRFIKISSVIEHSLGYASLFLGFCAAVSSSFGLLFSLLPIPDSALFVVAVIMLLGLLGLPTNK